MRNTDLRGYSRYSGFDRASGGRPHEGDPRQCVECVDVLGRPITSGLTVVDVHQEHGEIRSSSRLPFEKLPIGSKIRIMPNHVCMTAAMYDNYLVADGTDAIVDVWERTNGWS
ncbi:MAG TPA: hypothetical protein VFX20_04775 [Steroidobacteraceae bacterium]|nr:hypothetical protein [Steroidobacteraceae bacterium]